MWLSTVLTVLLLTIFFTPTVSQDTNTDTTMSDGFDCIWLNRNFRYSNGSYTMEYNGTCCSQTAINTLKENSQYSWIIEQENPQSINKCEALTQLLFCTPGACTEPNPVWTNCSGVFRFSKFLAVLGSC
uniref:Uncharacterized protein n=1 Tax=Caenorhabditis japonica TaxID=281687 RepID=A0A8R1DTV9_CAEJA